MNNHLYKIGQKVRHGLTGRDFYIVGIKTSSFQMTGLTEARLIVHENKSEPSRNGYPLWPCHVEVIDDINLTC